MTELHLHHPDYDPDKLLDTLIDRLDAKSDVGLCSRLGILPPAISKIRHRRLGIGPILLISMHEESGLSIKELRMLMGDRREHFRSIQA
jgi:hypothetical protein